MKTILLVEDDPFITDIYYNQLKKDGYNVLAAKTVVDALEKIKNNHPDLLVLDLNLKGNDEGPGDGLNILREMKKSPKNQNIKIIVSSNYSVKTHPELSQLTDLGVIKSFVKIDLDPGQLSVEIKEILK